MIPKIIHYCWFGRNPLPKTAEKCIRSWKKYCPDYEIIRWDESNFDVNCNEYCREMYEQEKWAFLTDYVRLRVVYENGGIYLDTDVEVIKPLDDLLHNSAYMGLETTDKVATGLGFGAERNHWFIGENMKYYEKWRSSDSVETCPIITTKLLKPFGVDVKSNVVQHYADIAVYPTEFFCPIDFFSGKKIITSNTYSVHHFSATWFTAQQKKAYRKSKNERRKMKRLAPFKRIIKKLFGEQGYQRIRVLWVRRYRR